MTTPQREPGTTDEDHLKRVLHSDRFGGPFWNFFRDHIADRVSTRPAVVDLGCGPGLLLQDLRELYPNATLLGYDAAPEMIAHARGLPFSDSIARFEVRDITAEPLPLPSGSIDLVTMSTVLYVLDDPLPVLLDIRRLLKHQGGVFFLHDWGRISLAKYLGPRLRNVPEDRVAQVRLQWLRQFPIHNKYSQQDWKWLLRAAGFKLIAAEKGTEYTVVMAFRP